MRRTIRTIDQKMVAVHGSHSALFTLILITILFRPRESICNGSYVSSYGRPTYTHIYINA
jgi:hypothetical protein